MTNNPYTAFMSTDYERLKQLLDEGNEIIIFDTKEHKTYLAHSEQFDAETWLIVGSIVWIQEKYDDSAFMALCESYNYQFLDPDGWKEKAVEAHRKLCPSLLPYGICKIQFNAISCSKVECDTECSYIDNYCKILDSNDHI